MTTENNLIVQSKIDWTPEQVQLIKDTICRESTNDEFKLFLYTARRTGLDPLSRQIHAVKRWDSNLQKNVMSIQTGIDGYRVIAERSGQYAGVDEPKFGYNKDNVLESATVTVYRIIQGQRVGFTATAFFEEYVQLKKDGKPNSFWSRMPRGQLSKCAESLALRKAFPNDLSGIYTHEEMQQADREPIDTESVDMATGEITNPEPQQPVADRPNSTPEAEKTNPIPHLLINEIMSLEKRVFGDTTDGIGWATAHRKKFTGSVTLQSRGELQLRNYKQELERMESK
jgi:phage recombination protein Bet